MKKIFEEFKEDFKYCSNMQKIAVIGGLMMIVGMCVLGFGVFLLDLPLLLRVVFFLAVEGAIACLGSGLIQTMM